MLASAADGLLGLAAALPGLQDEDDDVQLADDVTALHSQQRPGSLYDCTKPAAPLDVGLGALIDDADDPAQEEEYETQQEYEEMDEVATRYLEHDRSATCVFVYPWMKPGLTNAQKKRSLRNFRYRVRKRMLNIQDLFQMASDVPGSDDCYLVLCDTGRANGTTAYWVGC